MIRGNSQAESNRGIRYLSLIGIACQIKVLTGLHTLECISSFDFRDCPDIVIRISKITVGNSLRRSGNRRIRLSIVVIPVLRCHQEPGAFRLCSDNIVSFIVLKLRHLSRSHIDFQRVQIALFKVDALIRNSERPGVGFRRRLSNNLESTPDRNLDSPRSKPNDLALAS